MFNYKISFFNFTTIINSIFDAWNVLFFAFITEIILFFSIVNTSRIINNTYSIAKNIVTAFDNPSFDDQNQLVFVKSLTQNAISTSTAVITINNTDSTVFVLLFLFMSTISFYCDDVDETYIHISFNTENQNIQQIYIYENGISAFEFHCHNDFFANSDNLYITDFFKQQSSGLHDCIRFCAKHNSKNNKDDACTTVNVLNQTCWIKHDNIFHNIQSNDFPQMHSAFLKILKSYDTFDQTNCIKLSQWPIHFWFRSYWSFSVENDHVFLLFSDYSCILSRIFVINSCIATQFIVFLKYRRHVRLPQIHSHENFETEWICLWLMTNWVISNYNKKKSCYIKINHFSKCSSVITA